MVQFFGESLDWSDLDSMKRFRLGRQHPLGDTFGFLAIGLLMPLGFTSATATHGRLHFPNHSPQA